MFGFKFNKNSITKIAICLPPLLIKSLDKKDFYCQPLRSGEGYSDGGGDGGCGGE
jgi:hypothetical protein